MKILTFFLTFLSLSLYAEGYNRFDLSANAFRDGESIEIGWISPYSFKMKEDSRHTWSFFTSVGVLTLANVALIDETEVKEETFNVEVILGIAADAQFYDDFIHQYGKFAIDTIFLSDDFEEESSVTGFMLESGLEFRSNKTKPSFWDYGALHMGLRWRFLFPALDSIQGKPDPIEGISFVIGVRNNF